jgi:hypothetical protein
MTIRNYYIKLNAILLGYLTRKFKRNMPINEKCCSCEKVLTGKIHRSENPCEDNESTITTLIMYKSDFNDDKGISSFSHDLISMAYKVGNIYYCNECINKKDTDQKCSICLTKITKKIRTKCNHNFCFKCLIDWIKIDNINNEVFYASCPLCRNNI